MQRVQGEERNEEQRRREQVKEKEEGKEERRRGQRKEHDERNKREGGVARGRHDKKMEGKTEVHERVTAGETNSRPEHRERRRSPEGRGTARGGPAAAADCRRGGQRSQAAIRVLAPLGQ